MSSPATRTESPHVGITLFDRYRITGYLRADSCGDRYLVKPIGGGSTAVARVLSHPVFVRAAGSTWDNVRKRLARLTMIDHPNVERFVASGTICLDERPYFCVITGQSSGPTLEARMADRQRIPAAEALMIGQRVVHGLAAIHQLGLVHGDLRASNIKLAQGLGGTDADTWPVLGDACLANLVFDAFGRAPALRELLFAPEFTAPEQIEGEFTSVATDVYSFGLVLYRMLTGQAPFVAGDSTEMLAAKLTAEPRSLRDSVVGPGLPSALIEVLRRCLERSPRDRYESMPALLRALQECQQDLTALRVSPYSLPSDPEARVSSEGLIDRTRRSQPPSAILAESALLRASVEPVPAPAPASALASAVAFVSPSSSEALDSPAPAAPSSVRTMADDSAFLELFSEVITLKRMMGVSLALACGALVMTGVSVLAHRDATVTTVAASVPLQRANIRLAVRSNAPGASVLLRGRSFALPLTTEVPVGTDPELVEVSAPGHALRRMWLVLSEHSDTQVNLAPNPRELAAPLDLSVGLVAPLPSAPPPISEPARGRRHAYIRGSDIRHFVRARIPEIRGCVIRARRDAPDLTGRITIEMTIGPDGRVRAARPRRSTALQPVAECLAGVVAAIEFPPTGHDLDIVRAYSFRLR